MTTTIADPIFQGEGKWFQFALVDENGTAIDVSTASFGFQVRQNIGDAAPLFSATEFDITQAALGIVKANLPATQTLLMTAGTYYCQLLTTMTADTDVDISDYVKFKVKVPVVEA
jgi:hypothetical protein